MKKAIIIISSIILVFFSYAYFVFQEVSNSGFSLNKNLVVQLKEKRSKYVTLDKIPKNLKNAIVATEDKRFYEHGAIDIYSISRALFNNAKEGEITSGGSTLTQQLAKNLFLSTEKTYFRKLKEAIIAFKIERDYSKDQIIEMYLNTVYFGEGANGIYECVNTYFKKDIKDLTLSECALIAGIPQSPNLYNPIQNYKLAEKKQKIVLSRMVKDGYISQEQMNEALINK